LLIEGSSVLQISFYPVGGDAFFFFIWWRKERERVETVVVLLMFWSFLVEGCRSS